ncbi:MAG: hypothetical protein Q9N62_13235 [Ghiorsea sp.]|nr:hypothetical protein [Ghiorsea sp.]
MYPSLRFVAYMHPRQPWQELPITKVYPRKKDNVNAIARKQQHNVSVEHKKKVPPIQGSYNKKDKTPKQSSVKQTVTNAYLWDLYKARLFTKARQIIQQTKTQYPNWSPDPNIEQALAEQKT